MMNPSSSRTPRLQPLLLSAAALGAFAAQSQAQVVFSIDYRGASIGTPATGGGCITAADLLIAPGGPHYGAPPAPGIFVSGGLGPPGPGLGLVPLAAVCACPAPGLAPCARELDALSFGRDALIKPVQMPAGTWIFSVDACSMSPGGALAPNVMTEAPCGDSAADVFESLVVPAAPVPPFAVVPGMGNTGIVDGNGLVSCSGAVYPGLGLVEPRFPGVALTGDDVDAIDVGPVPTAFPFPVYFSLDAAFPNVCSGVPNTGSAMAYGFPPAAVLVTMGPGGPPVVYAPPAALGLDMFGPGTDDLDALALRENGVAGFAPAAGPYAWLAAGGPDEIFFSVRRGSAVIGSPDSIFGAPIEPGDILIPPVAGGLSPFPGIFVAAEALGLATARAGAPIAAELDALDAVEPAQTGIPYCFGTAAACPCGNAGAPGNGCAHSSNPLGANIAAAGIAQVSADTVVLTGSGMPAGGPCLYFQGTAQAALPFGDGILCIGGAIIRLGVKFNNALGSSTIPSGADPVLSVMGAVPPAGGFRFSASWYRDSALFCTPATFNVANGVGVLWTP
jgi:hypothetical protein